jgi:hypothetical protein
MGEHRVSMLGSLRRVQDPARSSDPQVRAVLAGLATLQAPPARAHFRAELRAQLVAVAPRLVAEGLAAEAAPVARGAIAEPARPLPVTPGPDRPRRTVFARVRSAKYGRPLALVSMAVAIAAFLLGGAVWISQHALPGDALYGLKRASESVELATASGPVDKAHDLLTFARTRSTEVSELLGDAGSGHVGSSTARLVASTLGSADSDVRQASRLLGEAAVQRSSAAPLAVLMAWAPQQAAALQAIADKTDDPALHARAEQSLGLLQAAVTRAAQLERVLPCMGGADSDALGPIPVSRCTAQGKASAPKHGTTPRTTSPPAVPGATLTPSGSATTGTTTVQVGGTSAAPGAASGSASAPSASLPIPVPIPSVPLPSPITSASCGAEVSLGPVDVSLGPCGVSAKVGG